MYLQRFFTLRHFPCLIHLDTLHPIPHQAIIAVPSFLSVLPLFVHIKTARSALSAERVYDIHCITFGSRPSALVTWWLGNTQLLDHSTSVRHHVTSWGLK